MKEIILKCRSSDFLIIKEFMKESIGKDIVDTIEVANVSGYSYIVMSVQEDKCISTYESVIAMYNIVEEFTAHVKDVAHEEITKY